MVSVYVNLNFDENTDHLPWECWEEWSISGLRKNQNAETEAVGFALENSGLSPFEFPSVVYTSLQKPMPGASTLVTRHRVHVDK